MGLVNALLRCQMLLLTGQKKGIKVSNSEPITKNDRQT